MVKFFLVLIIFGKIKLGKKKLVKQNFCQKKIYVKKSLVKKILTWGEGVRINQRGGEGKPLVINKFVSISFGRGSKKIR